MKLTLQVQALPDANQKSILLDTMERYNAAASLAARVGIQAGVFSQPSIHQRCYAEIRQKFGLSAQMAVRAIGKAVEAFASLKAKGETKCPIFQPRGAVTYDERILSFKGLDKVSLWALGGRMILPIIYGQYQGQRLGRLKGQVDLVYQEGKFFLYATVDVPEEAPIEVTDFLGVDLGLVNLVADSDGATYSGAQTERVRRRHHANRRRRPAARHQGARKRLKRLAKREGRFRRHENHCISKAIVSKAKDTGRGIVLEDLQGIRDRTTVRAKDRSRHSGWAFAQLRSFLEYKAVLAGVPVVLVDPRNTSRTCSVCSHCEKANRKSQAQFVCLHCGYSANADFNAAQNLRALGLGCDKPPSELAG